jgi:ribosomal protein S12 methylthiotransferase
MASRLITPSRSGSKKTTIGFVNLGCSKNQVDSEIMLVT